MSRIYELIKQHCPQGVPNRLMGEIGTITRGKRFVKSDIVDFGAPCIHYGELYTKYGTWATETFSHLEPSHASRLRRARPGDVIIVSAGETVEDIGKAVAWLGSEEVVTHDALYSFRSPLDPKYVAYFSQTGDFHSQIRRHISSSKISAISTENLGKVLIPVPPIEVQQEIVKVLDAFSKLEAELEAELEARQYQYTFYRDSLLASAGGSKVLMGEVGVFHRGRRFTKKDVVDVGIPAIHYGEIYTHYGVSTDITVTHVRAELSNQLRFAEPGDVVIATVGETVEDVAKAVAWLGNVPVAIHDDTAFFRSEMNPKYVSYAMQTADFHAQKNKHVARGKVKRLSGDGLSRIAIPVPSREGQDRVVEILDKFDALVNDLSVGLPAELNARRQQYEHYRDRLLTFQEAG